MADIRKINEEGSVGDDQEELFTDIAITLDVKITLNAVEIVYIDRLLNLGLYGNTRPQVIKRLLDERIRELQRPLDDSNTRKRG